MKRSSLANHHLLYRYFLSVLSGILPSSFISTRILKFACTSIIFCVCINSTAQQTTDEQKLADYKKVINERSSKIVKTLGLNDTGIYNKVLSEISNQYFSLNAIHENFKAAVSEVKDKAAEKTVTDEAVKKLEEKKSSDLLQQHKLFVGHLKESLNDEQLGKVKDGMTYSVLQVTYKAYQEMLLNLTTEQKEKIYNWLVEARELAMDEGSSEDKHKVFGKYKGRINNYLSAQGIDMKKEEKEWQSRIKEKQNPQKQSS